MNPIVLLADVDAGFWIEFWTAYAHALPFCLLLFGLSGYICYRYGRWVERRNRPMRHCENCVRIERAIQLLSSENVQQNIFRLGALGAIDFYDALNLLTEEQP